MFSDASHQQLILLQTIAYELHILDLTIDEASGVCAKGKYVGLAERKTNVSKKDSKTNFVAKTKMLNDTHLTPASKVELDSTSFEHIIQIGVIPYCGTDYASTGFRLR